MITNGSSAAYANRPQPRSSRWDLLVASALVLAGVLLYASYRDQFLFWLEDEGYLYYGAFAIDHGAVPYTDLRFLHYLPGIFDTFAALFAITGPSIVAARTLMLAGLALVPCLLYLTARRFVGTAIGLGMATVALLVPGPWFLFYVPLLNIALVYTLLQVHQGTRSFWGLTFGAVLSVAFCTRMDLAISGGLLLATWWLLEGWSLRPQLRRRLGAIVIGGLLIGLPYHILLASRGILADFYGQYIGFASRLVKQPAYSSGLPAPPFRTGWLLYGSGVPVGALCVLAAHRLWWAAGRDEKRRAASYGIVAIWVLSNVPHYGVWRPDPSHLALHGVAVLLATGIVLQEALDFLRGGRWSAAHFGAAAGLCALVVYVIMFAGTFTRDRCCGGPGIQQPVAWYTLSNGMRFPGRPQGGVPALLERVIQGTGEEERVAALPYAPGLNFLVRRRTPGRNVFIFPLPTSVSSPLEDQEREILADLAHVRFVLYLPQQKWMVGDRAVEPPDYMPRIIHLLQAEFRTVAFAEGMNLLERKAAQ